MANTAKQNRTASKWTVSSTDWDDIAASNPQVLTTKNFNYKEIASISGKKLYLGEENLSGIKCFMFKASRGAVQEKDLPATKGLEVRFDFGFIEKSEIAIVLKLLNEDFIEVFTALLNDIIATVDEKTDEQAFVAAFFNRLTIWKLFFDNSSPEGLGPERRRGLFGELYFLREMIIPHFGVTGIKYWVGPEAATHDFELGGAAIEVKTSAGKKSQRITISSERQLDDAGYKTLFLTEFSIAVRRHSSPNLVEMIRTLETLLSVDQSLLVRFRNLLLMSGYSPLHDDRYLLEGYHVEETNYYVVKEGFPRLLGRDLKPGIGGIKYTVDLSACKDFKVDADEIKSFLAKQSKKEA
jgi:hypothetical protein